MPEEIAQIRGYDDIVATFKSEEPLHFQKKCRSFKQDLHEINREEVHKKVDPSTNSSS